SPESRYWSKHHQAVDTSPEGESLTQQGCAKSPSGLATPTASSFAQILPGLDQRRAQQVIQPALQLGPLVIVADNRACQPHKPLAKILFLLAQLQSLLCLAQLLVYFFQLCLQATHFLATDSLLFPHQPQSNQFSPDLRPLLRIRQTLALN